MGHGEGPAGPRKPRGKAASHLSVATGRHAHACGWSPRTPGRGCPSGRKRNDPRCARGGLLRGHRRGLPLVRPAEYRAALSFRSRSLLHALRIFRSAGGGSRYQLHATQFGAAGRCRGCAALPRTCGRSAGTHGLEVAGWVSAHCAWRRPESQNHTQREFSRPRILVGGEARLGAGRRRTSPVRGLFVTRYPAGGKDPSSRIQCPETVRSEAAARIPCFAACCFAS